MLNTDVPGVFSNIVPVFINIIDVDDNVPRFVNRSYRYNFPYKIHNLLARASKGRLLGLTRRSLVR